MFDPNSQQAAQHEQHIPVQHQQVYSIEKKGVEKGAGDFPFCYNVNMLEKVQQGSKMDGRFDVAQTPFTYNYALVNQMQLAAASSTNSMFACDICGLVFGNITLLNHHKRVQHSNAFSCDLCTSTFVQENDLKAHKEAVHNMPPKKVSVTCSVQTDGEVIKEDCSKCNHGCKTTKEHKSKVSMKQKNKREDGQILYPKGYYPVKKKRTATIVKCHKCDGSGIVVVETTPPTPEKRFRCNICGSLFATYSSMWSHRRLHSGEKPYKCEVCGVAFARAAYLKNHSRVHTGERPFKCDVCGMQFSQSAHLKNHSRIHSGERPYECDVCQKSFARHSTLWNHRRIHTGEKPYECGICGSAFNQATHLRNHVKVHTGEKQFTCDVCDVGFSDRFALKRHRAVHEKFNQAGPPIPSANIAAAQYRPPNTMDNTVFKCNPQSNIAFPGCSRPSENE